MNDQLRPVRVCTYTETVTENQQSWKLPFNQVCFMNYDLNQPVTINNDIIVPKAVQDPATMEIYPTFFRIELRRGEINDTNFIFNFNGSTTAQLVIVHTEYNHGLS